MTTSRTFPSGQLSLTKVLITVISLFIFTVLLNTNSMAQDRTQMVRLAKIKVDPLQLKKYNTALKEQMTTAIIVSFFITHFYNYIFLNWRFNRGTDKILSISAYQFLAVTLIIATASFYYFKYQSTVNEGQ